MKNRIHFPNLISYFSIALASIFFVAEIHSKEEQKNNSLLINDDSNTNKILKDNLKPMPIGDFNSASQKVKSNRNPFQKPEKSELSSLDDIYSTLIFKGIARSGDELLAIIETDNVQKFYDSSSCNHTQILQTFSKFSILPLFSPVDLFKNGAFLGLDLCFTNFHASLF